MLHHLFQQPLTPENSLTIDLSAKNLELNPSIFASIELFCEYMDKKLEGKIGYGGYLEHRIIYEAHENFLTTQSNYRNIHLGMDFWTKAGTPIFAPLDGIVHSFQINPGSGNYGPTVILYHPQKQLYSLYGHLAATDLIPLKIGAVVPKGQLLCHLGNPTENGGWPPHLHFQLIRDLQEFWGDYPGVCSKEELDFYAMNCPDPAEVY